jgi:hypothetical protein
MPCRHRMGGLIKEEEEENAARCGGEPRREFQREHGQGTCEKGRRGCKPSGCPVTWIPGHMAASRTPCGLSSSLLSRPEPALRSRQDNRFIVKYVNVIGVQVLVDNRCRSLLMEMQSRVGFSLRLILHPAAKAI